MMMHHMSGPPLGNLIVMAVSTLITLACVVAAVWMLVRPGEKDPDHPKRRVLRDDR